MGPIDALIIIGVILLVGGIAFYLYRSRKNGVQCVGCPDGKKCSSACKGCNDDESKAS